MTTVLTTPWSTARRRATALRERYAFAGELLGLYLGLVEVWEEAWADARAAGVASAEVAAWSARRVLPQVVAATAEAGPAPLVEQLLTMRTGDAAAAEELLSAWLAGEELDPAERYLARASLRGPLAAVGPAETSPDAPAYPNRQCPECGGLPQLSFRRATGDDLGTGARRLVCCRCSATWAYASGACAGCGQAGGRKVTYYAERRSGLQVPRSPGGDAVFPHLRIEGCTSCQRYLLDVDLNSDPRAVPEVDEIAGLPLDLFAAERGFTKITPNMMGF